MAAVASGGFVLEDIDGQDGSDGQDEAAAYVQHAWATWHDR
jgi:hypothetical protein